MATTSVGTKSADRARQQQTSHMLKTGRRGNPFCKDTHDLFATLMVSLELTDHTRFFKTYTNSFTTDEAAANLSSLRFSQSNRQSDPNDPQRIITTTTTTTFSMSREIAKGICQHFMDARLIENATDPSSLAFKDRGIFQITPKGLHVLERFITKNGISADHLVGVFTSQPICMKLLHLERRLNDDEIHISRGVIEVVFRRFSGGRHPNYVVDPVDTRSAPQNARAWAENVKAPSTFDRESGIEFQDVVEKSKAGPLVVTRQVFNSVSAIDWLLDFTTCCCRDEAGELLAHFVRYKLIALFSDKSRVGDRVSQLDVTSSGSGVVEYRHGPRILYHITDEGRKVASSPEAHASAGPKPATSSGLEVRASSEGRSVDDDASSAVSADRKREATDRSFAGGTGLGAAESQIVSKMAAMELLRADLADGSTFQKDQQSTTARLRAILDEPGLRTLFRDFLRQNYCDENLAFWIDVSDFRRRFSTTSTAVGGAAQPGKRKTGNAMETHQQNLVAAALHIFNTYLAPLSPNELNIDHNLRADVVNYVNRSLSEVMPSGSKAYTGAEGEPVPPLRATQVQTLLRQYERIQEHIFRLLATDQVPRFVRTEAFLQLVDPEKSREQSSPIVGEKGSPLMRAGATSPRSKAIESVQKTG